jgi:eukaryotic-like serine/threonine-protein kinase
VETDRRGGSTPPEARVGATLNGKWRVDRLIEVGGMSAVYEVTHRNGRRAAIKMLQTRFASDPEVRRRFLREGYVANKIDHPGAVDILDDDTAEDGAPFLVMELLEGESLATWLARAGGKLRVIDMLGVAEQLLEVLGIAHANGIVHRDIKPGNVFVTATGHAKLLDFGLARIRDGALSLVPTAAGIVLGTAGYMAPEQARGVTEEIDARADIFAVGALMFRAIAGRPIHDKPTQFDTIVSAMSEHAPAFASVVADAPPLLAAALDRALAFDKESRWPTARSMSGALRAAYDEMRRRPPPLPRARARASGAPAASSPAPADDTRDTGETSVAFDLIEAPSLVVDIAFGEHHADAVERERRRAREVIEDMAGAGGPTKGQTGG